MEVEGKKKVNYPQHLGDEAFADVRFLGDEGEAIPQYDDDGELVQVEISESEEIHFTVMAENEKLEIRDDLSVNASINEELKTSELGSGVGVSEEEFARILDEFNDPENEKVKELCEKLEVAYQTHGLEASEDYLDINTKAVQEEQVVEPIVEVEESDVVTKPVNKEETNNLKVENMEEIKETKSGTKARKLSANGRVMDAVDYTILFLRSSQWAFVLVLLGVFGQAFHIYHVVYNLSDMMGFQRVASSLIWAGFLSFGLVYFTLKLGTLKTTDYTLRTKYMTTVSWFIAFDVFANLYYWSYRFVLMPAVLENFMKDYADGQGNIFRDVDWSAVDWMTFEISKVQWPQMIAATILAFSIPFILKAFAGEVRLPEFMDSVFRSYKEDE